MIKAPEILLVEDDDPKRKNIEGFLYEIMPELSLSVSRSVRSAISSLQQKVPDLAILDMSLPTFDIGPQETGGRPQGFGGIELLRIMELEDIYCPALIITGYEAFAKAGGQVALDSVAQELLAEHPQNLKGVVHYNSSYGDWKERLLKTLTELGLTE